MPFGPGNRRLYVALAAAAATIACESVGDPVPSGNVRIIIQQALTGATTSAGTFQLTGAVTDDGTTTEELTFGGPLTEPVVPVTFRRVITGNRGTMTITGSASLTWTSQTAGALSGSWQVESATGVYATGSGSLSGTANFGATPPTAAITYDGVINR
jgi:hypothetical protein